MRLWVFITPNVVSSVFGGDLLAVWVGDAIAGGLSRIGIVAVTKFDKPIFSKAVP